MDGYIYVMLTPGQIRAARGFLRWSARELAERTDVHVTTVQRIERMTGPVYANTETMRRIEQALEAAGVEFFSYNGYPGVSFGLSEAATG